MAGKSDGVVIVDTKIDTSGIDKGASTTKNKISSLGNALNKLGATIKNTFSGKLLGKGSNAAIQNYDSQIKKLEAQLDRLIEKQIRFVETGGDKKSRTMAGMEYDIEMVRTKLEELRAKQAQVATGVNTQKSSTQFLALKDSLVKVGQAAGNALSKVLKFANNAVNAGLKKLNAGFKKLASYLFSVDKNAKKSNYSIMKMLGTSVLFSAVFRAISAITTGFKDGMLELARTSDSLTKSLSSLKTTLLQLRNSFVAAFAPIIQIAIPYIDKFISYINQALNYVAQFVAALVGQDTYKRVIRVEQSIDDTAASLDGVKDSAQDAKKALEGYLSPLDEINKYSSGEKIDIPGVSDVGTADSPLMFEDVAIEGMFKDLADKFKMLAGSLFAPLKKAWEEAGQFVMDSWLFALDQAWLLIKDIGKDFLEVWNQAETVNIFEDILYIIGDIGLVVGILIQNFREAWNYADTGKGILEGIRDIIGVITDNILHAADATVEWAKEIDFVPLLTKLEELVNSLVPVFDNLSGILTDFYENVILPLGEWTLEEGLPQLLQVFIDFNNEVDWEALRNRLSEFWTHLEPFAETVGAGLIEFIDRLADGLANFINSDEFDDFLTSVENWMDKVEPNDVADGLENIAKAIIGLKAASIGLGALSGLASALSTLANVFLLFNTPAFSAAFAKLGGLAGTIAGWAPHIATALGIANVLERIKTAVSERTDTSDWNLFDWITNSLKMAIQGWLSDFENFKISLELWWQDTWLSNAIWNFEQWWSEKVSPWFTVEKWQELWENIKTAFSEKWKEFSEWWDNTIAKWWENNVSPWFTVEKWEETIENVRIAFETKFTEIMQKLQEIWEEIKTNTSEVIAEIESNISEKLANIKETWNTAWDSFSTKISDVWTSITDTVSSAVESIKGWIDEILGMFDKTEKKANKFSGRGWTSSFSSIVIPSIPNYGTYSVNVPKLATGSVIPPNAPFLAMLGDQRHGTNIEAPEDLIRKIVREESGRNNGNGATYHFVAQLDGQTLFEQFVSQAKLNQTATGQNILVTL